MVLPHPPILNRTEPPIVGVPGPNGVLTTAVPPSQPEPIAPPVSPFATEDPTALEGLFAQDAGGVAPVDQGDPLSDLFAGDEQAVDPSDPFGLGDLLSTEALQTEETEGLLRQTSFGNFDPRDFAELTEVEHPGFGTALEAGWSDGLLGWVFSGEEESQRDKDKFELELMNYATTHPWKSFLGQMAGGFVSDLPVEVLLAIGTAGVGNGIIAGARAAGRGSKALRMMSRGVINIKKAYRFKGGPGRLRRLAVRGMYETSLGAVSGVISEAAQQGLGKEGDIEDVIERAALDALASGPFAEALRFGAKGLRAVRGISTSRRVARDMAPLIEEETGIPAARLEELITRAGDEATFDARQRGAGEEEATFDRIAARNKARRELESARSQTPHSARQTVLLDDAANAKANAERAAFKFNNNRGVKFLRGVVEALLSPEHKGRADELIDVLARRARGAGMELDDWLKARRLRFSVGKDPQQIVNQHNAIIEAPSKATTFTEFLHEVGHLIFGDLDDAQRLEVEKILKRKLGKDAMPEDVYEEFADQFQRYIETGDASSRPKRRMFERIKQWLGSVYRKIMGKEEIAEMPSGLSDLFNRIMNETSEPSATPTAAKQAAEFKRRDKEGLTALFSGGKGKRAERARAAKAKADAEAKAAEAEAKAQAEGEEETPVQAAQRQVKEEALATASDAEGVASDANKMLPRTPAAKALNAVKVALGRLLGSDNYSLYGFLPRLGPAWQRIHAMINPAVTRSAELYNLMRDPFSKFMKKIPASRIAALDETRTVTLNTIKGEGDDATFQDVDITMSGTARMKATMQSLDGFNRDKTHVSENSGQKALQDVGLIDEATGKVHRLSDEELAFIQDGGLLSAEEHQMMNAFFDSYRAIVKDANEISQEFIGRDIFDVNNYYYNPKNVEGKNDVDVMFAALIGNSTEMTELAKQMFRTRQGSGALNMVNPFQELSNYARTVSHTLAMVRFNKTAKEALEQSGRLIKAHYGKPMLDSLTDLVNLNSGDFSSIGKFTEQGIISRLFSLRQIGLMGANPSVIMKQLGSSWLAAATGKVSSSGSEMGRDAARLLTNSADRAKLLDEMSKHNPVMARRLRDQIQIIEFEQSSAGLSSILFAKDKLTAKELLALGRGKDVKLTDVASALVQKTAEGIRLADESTLGAIWNAVKKDVLKAGELKEGSDEFWGELVTRFNDLLLETQPTLDPTTRSFNQMKPGLGFRALTQFSTQTRKIWEFGDTALMKYINIPKELRTEADVKEFREAMLPLMAQAAYISAVGFTSSAAIAGGLGLIQSDSRRKRLEAHNKGVAVKALQQAISNSFGARPVSGKIAADMINSMFGNEPFGVDIPVISEVTDFQKGVSDRSAQRAFNSIAQLLGLPSWPRRAASAVVGRATE